jgi:hypothetical protein
MRRRQRLRRDNKALIQKLEKKCSLRPRPAVRWAYDRDRKTHSSLQPAGLTPVLNGPGLPLGERR